MSHLSPGDGYTKSGSREGTLPARMALLRVRTIGHWRLSPFALSPLAQNLLWSSISQGACELRIAADRRRDCQGATMSCHSPA
jgi:hypothetical protein